MVVTMGMSPASSTALTVLAVSMIVTSGQTPTSLVFPKPENVSWSEVTYGDLIQIEIMDDMNGYLGTATTCANASSLHEWVDANFDALRNDEIKIPSEYLCGFSQTYQPGDQELLVRFSYDVDLYGTFFKADQPPSPKINFKKRDAFTVPRIKTNMYSSPYEVPNPFNQTGEILAEFTISNPVSKKGLLSLQVEQPDQLAATPQAFLIINEMPNYTYPESSQDPWKDCQNDCSCTRRFLYEKYNSAMFGRRLASRGLQTEDCTMLGESPTAARPCCGASFECTKDWYSEGNQSSICVDTESQCTDMNHDDGVITFLQNNYTNWSECENDQSCAQQIMAWANAYGHEDPLHVTDASLLYNMSSSYPFPRDSPFGKLFEFIAHTFRQMFVMELSSKGDQISPDKCLPELETCLSDDLCRAIALPALFIKEDTRESFIPFITKNQSYVEPMTMLQNLTNCMPFSMHFNGGGYQIPSDQVQLAVPLYWVPCACSNGTASSFDQTTFNTVGPYKHAFGIDLCFGNIGVEAAVQIKVFPGSNDTVGLTNWTSPNVELSPNIIADMQGCQWNRSKCDSLETSSLLAKLEAGGRGHIKLPKSKCGYMGRDWVTMPGFGSVEQCKPLTVGTDMISMLSKPLSDLEVGFPGVKFSFIDVPEMMTNVLFAASFEASDVHFQRGFFEVDGWTAAQTEFLLMGRPFVPEHVTLENCDSSCSCTDLYLATYWDQMYTGELPFLQVPAHQIPCPCSKSEFPRRHLSTRSTYSNGEEKRSVVSRLEVCARGHYILAEDYSLNVESGISPFNYVCNCDGDMFHCKGLCQISRGPWAWTCENFDGARLVQENSQEHNDLRMQCK